MANLPHTRFPVTDRSYLALTKKSVSRLAGEVGFAPHRLPEIDLIVAEMLSNLIKHAGGGELLVRPFRSLNQTGLELISIDSGPGMADPARMMQDGVSTTGTLGQGLGSIHRLADLAQLYSLKGWGTILLTRIFTHPERPGPAESGFDYRTLLTPMPGETMCGDGYYVKRTSDHIKLFLGDGLGHGPEAHRAVQEAVNAFRLCPDHRPVEILRFMHRAVSKTRGLVGSVVVYEATSRQWSWCGVGNIATRVGNLTTTKMLMPYNGIIGLNMPVSLHNHELVLERGQLLILCSDGVQSRWDQTKYPLIHRYDLSILAAALYKDYARQTDDTSLFVGRFIP